MQCWRCNRLLACGGSGKAGVYKLAESILSKLLTALEMEKADKAMFEVRLRGRGSQDLGNQYERTRSLVQYRKKWKLIL